MASMPATSLLFLSLIGTSLAFILNPSYRQQSKLFGLAEWREQVAGDETRPILLLPFSADEALVQGQSTEIVLTEGRFFDLFQDCIDDYESIVGMALMGDDGFLNTFPLCEIDDFDVRSGYRGKVTVSVTLRAVGRASLIQLTQMEPVMMGTITELVDLVSSEDELAVAKNLVGDIETIVQDLSRTSSDIKVQYDNAYRDSLETLQQDSSSLTASSWANFAIVADRSYFYKEAISSVSLVERLQVGRKALLDAKFQLSNMDVFSNQDSADAGFE